MYSRTLTNAPIHLLASFVLTTSIIDVDDHFGEQFSSLCHLVICVFQPEPLLVWKHRAKRFHFLSKFEDFMSM